MARVALYLRVSTEAQEYDGQRAALMRWAEDAGHTIVAEYTDKMSGARRRENLDLLMQDAPSRRFDMVAFWALDRLSREGVLATLIHLNTLHRQGIETYSHCQPSLNPAMPYYFVAVAMVAEIAEQERQMISARTRMGLEKAKRRGVRLGRPPGSRDKGRRRRSNYYKRWESDRIGQDGT